MRPIGITATILLSLALNFLWLGREGFANLYYAAGVKSMLMSWHNFFFVSFDPGGFITIDKPPLGFWLQTLSAKVFGFQGWSILLPQALGGTISVFLIYTIVKRHNGELAGLIAALVLTLTPIFVAASRNNTIDVLLVTVVLLSSLVFLPGAESLSLTRLSLAFLLIGVGFNIKSLEAFLVLPSFYLTYLFTRHGQFRRKLLHLVIATIILVIVSLPWFILVDSIPPFERPYVGSSETNSELELATGYNGLGHFLGYGIKTPGRQTPPRTQAMPAPSASRYTTMGQTGGETGRPGLFRFFNHQMSGQISWLLPFALIGLVTALFKHKTLAGNIKTQVVFWSFWLIPEIIFFSIAQGAHRYYLVMVAPAIAALVGITYTAFIHWLSSSVGQRRYLLPGAIITTVAVQVYIIAGYKEWRSWMLPTVIGLGLLATFILGWKAQARLENTNTGSKILILLSVISLLAAPFAWSLTPLLYGSGNSAFPFAGPDLKSNSQQRNSPSSGVGFASWFDSEKLEAFLLANRRGEKFIVAVPNAHFASPLILDTGQPVMTYGGFMGAEKILTKEKLEEMVAGGQVRYVMIESTNRQQPEIDDWVRAHGTPIADDKWLPAGQTSSGTSSSARGMAMKLYECPP